MRCWTLLAMMVLLGWATLTAQAYQLQFKDAAGTTRNFKSKISVTGTVESGSIKAPISSTITFSTTEKVIGVEKDSARIDFSMREGNVTTKITGLPGDEPEQTIDQAMPAFTMTYNRTPQGKVTNLKTDGDVAKMLGGPMGFDPLSNQFQYPGQGLEFPQKDLKIGDKWGGKQTIEIGAGNKMDIDARYTLTGTETVGNKTYLRILCDFTVKTPKMTVNAGQNGEDIPLTLSLTMKGQSVTLFDEQAGEIFRTTLKGEMTSTMSSSLGEGMSAKTTMSLNGTMEKEQ